MFVRFIWFKHNILPFSHLNFDRWVVVFGGDGGSGNCSGLGLGSGDDGGGFGWSGGGEGSCFGDGSGRRVLVARGHGGSRRGSCTMLHPFQTCT